MGNQKSTSHQVATLLRILLFIFLAQALPVAAQNEVQGDLIVSREVWRDQSRTQTLNQIIGAPFVPVPGIYAGGYTRDTVWMRITVRPAADGGPVTLRIQPAYLNEITLYTPDTDQPSGWRSQQTGNATPWRTRALASVSLGFMRQPETQTTYYLRLNTLSNALLHVEAYPAHLAAQREIHDLLWQGLYIAVILWIIFWALQDYHLSRDQVILQFAITYLCYLLYLLAIMGHLSLLLPEQTHIPQITFFCVTLAIFTSVIFHRKLLQQFDLPRLSLWGLNLLGIKQN